MKLELQIDDEYEQLSRCLGFSSVDELIEHCLEIAKEAKGCAVLHGKDYQKNKQISVFFKNPRQTKRDKLKPWRRRRRRFRL